MTMKKILATGVAAAAMVFGAQSAMATGSPASATLNVSGTVDATCLIDASTALTITEGASMSGSAGSPTYATPESSQNVTYACTNGTSPSAYLSAASTTLTGTNGNAETPTVNFYSTSGTSSPYPISGGSYILLTGDGGNHTTPVYAQLVTTKTTKADTYTGSVTFYIAY